MIYYICILTNISDINSNNYHYHTYLYDSIRYHNSVGSKIDILNKEIRYLIIDKLDPLKELNFKSDDQILLSMKSNTNNYDRVLNMTNLPNVVEIYQYLNSIKANVMPLIVYV